MNDTLEEDFRAWLAADPTVAGLVTSAAGGAPVPNVYFTAVPTRVNGGFIGTRCARKDAVHTTSIGGGHLTLAKIVCWCCYKGPDPAANYTQAKAIAQAVKARVNQVNGTWVMGNTTVYNENLADSIEDGQGDTERDDEFSFHAGTSSGIQAVKVAVAFHYWSPNS